MQTALIIGGDLRTFLDCFPSLESNVLNYNNCDVYLHLYNEPLAEEAIKLLSPVRYLIEDKSKVVHQINEHCHSNKPSEVDPHRVFSQWRTVQKAFGLIENAKYDMVIKTRYDVKYTNPLKVDRYNPSCLNVPIGGDWRGGLFDMVAWGSQVNMNHYSSLYDRINKYVLEGVSCHSELLNLYNNKNNSINRCEYTVLLRRQFDRDFIEDRVFTLR
jgi:hypothetical protein